MGREDGEENLLESFASGDLWIADQGTRDLKWITRFQYFFPQPMQSRTLRGLRRNSLPTITSIRQHQTHQRHDPRRETDEEDRVLERQHRDRPQSLRGNDGGRKVVESFRIFLFGCYFHGVT